MMGGYDRETTPNCYHLESISALPAGYGSAKFSRGGRQSREQSLAGFGQVAHAGSRTISVDAAAIQPELVVPHCTRLRAAWHGVAAANITPPASGSALDC